MEIREYISHPERLDKDTLYELRSMLALYPYFQTARLLLLYNLYLLHDATFDEELRRAAIYITDRKVIFQFVEAAHYKLPTRQEEQPAARQPERSSRTMSLIENFLDSIPKDDEEEEQKKPRRKPTPADAAVDYVAYLLETEEETAASEQAEQTPLRGQELIDNFIRQDTGRIVLNETPEYAPSVATDDGKDGEEEYFTETLARIYVKQGRYSKALGIIQRLSLAYPKKNAYFADQIRFLQKLIINNNNKTTTK